ncbi:UNVERIFIED_CONTAM: hypothetical protein RMT77_006712 [Armadillidium vulgare]
MKNFGFFFALIFVSYFLCSMARSPAKPVCIITYDYRPLCASDGKTYSNRRAFNCEKRNNNKDLHIVHKGRCFNEDSSNVGSLSDIKY